MPSRSRSWSEIFLDEGSYGTTLLLAALALYPRDEDDEGFLAWSAEGALAQLEDDFGRIPQGNFDRLMAAKTVLTTDLIWGSLPECIVACNVLSGSPVSEEFEPADVYECAWGLTEAFLIHPGDALPPIDVEVRAYVWEMCKAAGVRHPPDILAEVVGPLGGGEDAANFSDDPDLHAAVWAAHDDRVRDIRDFLSQNAQALLTQVTTLPLPSAERVGAELGQKLMLEISKTSH